MKRVSRHPTVGDPQTLSSASSPENDAAAGEQEMIENPSTRLFLSKRSTVSPLCVKVVRGLTHAAGKDSGGVALHARSHAYNGADLQRTARGIRGGAVWSGGYRSIQVPVSVEWAEQTVCCYYSEAVIDECIL
ncbi:hypothetical protein MRX96_036796 [Rhipicephalus microplus]